MIVMPTKLVVPRPKLRRIGRVFITGFHFCSRSQNLLDQHVSPMLIVFTALQIFGDIKVLSTVDPSLFDS